MPGDVSITVLDSPNVGDRDARHGRVANKDVLMGFVVAVFAICRNGTKKLVFESTVMILKKECVKKVEMKLQSTGFTLSLARRETRKWFVHVD